jgi:hypothetical protein
MTTACLRQPVIDRASASSLLTLFTNRKSRCAAAAIRVFHNTSSALVRKKSLCRRAHLLWSQGEVPKWHKTGI